MGNHTEKHWCVRLVLQIRDFPGGSDSMESACSGRPRSTPGVGKIPGGMAAYS